MASSWSRFAVILTDRLKKGRFRSELLRVSQRLREVAGSIRLGFGFVHKVNVLIDSGHFRIGN